MATRITIKGIIVANKLLYKQEYCEELVRYMSGGKSFVSFAGHINVGKRTIYEWVEKYPEFKEAKDIAKAKCEEFYVNLGLDMAAGNLEKPNATAYVWLTKNILKWTDKEQAQEQERQPISINIVKD